MKVRSMVGTALLLGILLMISYIYRNSADHQRNLRKSNRLVLSSLEQQTQLMEQYSAELAGIKSKLDVLQAENNRLNQSLDLMAKERMRDLEITIAQLEERNTQIIQEMDDLREKTLHPEESIRTIADGRAMIVQYRQNIRQFKGRIHELKQEAHLERIAVQEEDDRMMLLLGNNGFMVRNGQPTPVEITMPSKEKEIKIDVTFVK